ncbi:ORF-91 [Catopsilia pomona nucleopolyhedrovirus]|uniref:ORF-91 n=1 Tax=Catopsilia pomona nucleopolyhedrovirus TaxID=1850906 RepID=A0A172WZG6_9ABAC|nr:ORF-91 [Catopsilia pomona nucleopolyhedrovirus]ANF29739.1 ORF-91 [Catopsilia pomona nucleopolyhedrovirus]
MMNELRNICVNAGKNFVCRRIVVDAQSISFRFYCNAAAAVGNEQNDAEAVHNIEINGLKNGNEYICKGKIISTKNNSVQCVNDKIVKDGKLIVHVGNCVDFILLQFRNYKNINSPTLNVNVYIDYAS